MDAIEFWNPAIAGTCGGLALGLGLLLMNAVENLRADSPSPRTGQMVATQLGVTVVLALLGGLCAHYLTGRAGDFLQGLAAIGFVLLVGGGAISSVSQHEGRTDAQTADRTR